MTVNNHNYLKSGLLESYLLGLASEKERIEVDQWLSTDQAVLDQLDELEGDMEQYFLRNAVPPPPSVRNAVLERINKDELQKWEPQEQTNSRRTEPRRDDASQSSAQPLYTDVSVSNTHIQVHKNWRVAFIAVFVLSKIFLILGLYYYFKSSSLEQEITRLKAAAQQTTPLPRSTP